MVPNTGLKELYIWVHSNYREVPDDVMGMWEAVIKHVAATPQAGLLRTKFYATDEGKLQELHETAEKVLGERYHVWPDRMYFAPQMGNGTEKLKEMFGIKTEGQLFLDTIYCYGLEPGECVSSQKEVLTDFPVSISVINCGLYPNL